MSKINILKSSMRRAAIQAGGSRQTISARQQTANTFVAWCHAHNRQTTDPKNKHIRDFFQYRQGLGDSAGTQQKIASHLRAMCPQMSMTNEQLKIPHRDRTGKKSPPAESYFRECQSKLRDPGARVAADLMKELGLRLEEAVQAGRSASEWRRSLERGHSVRIAHGTKGNRLRISEVPHRERALDAVKAAEKIAQQRDGRLIVGKQGDLKSAYAKLHNALSRAGFKKQHAPHSLRYHYARELYDKHTTDGIHWRESRSLVSLSLGHGDGRGKILKQVYDRR